MMIITLQYLLTYNESLILSTVNRPHGGGLGGAEARWSRLAKLLYIEPG